MRLISKFRDETLVQTQTALLARLLRLPPLTDDTRQEHIACIENSFDTYTPELLELFFYCREHIAPTIAHPTGTVFQDGVYSLYAAQICGYIHKCHHIGVPAELAIKLLYVMNAKLIELFYAVLCSSFSEPVTLAGIRMQNIGMSCLNSEAYGLSNQAHMVTQTIVTSVGEASSLLGLPDAGLMPFFQNMISIRCTQYSLMLTDANCIAHNILTSTHQCALFLGDTAPQTPTKGLLHCAYIPTTHVTGADS